MVIFSFLLKYPPHEPNDMHFQKSIIFLSLWCFYCLHVKLHSYAGLAGVSTVEQNKVIPVTLAESCLVWQPTSQLPSRWKILSQDLLTPCEQQMSIVKPPKFIRYTALLWQRSHLWILYQIHHKHMRRFSASLFLGSLITHFGLTTILCMTGGQQAYVSPPKGSKSCTIMLHTQNFWCISTLLYSVGTIPKGFPSDCKKSWGCRLDN